MITIIEGDFADLAQYESVPTAFTVTSQLRVDVVQGGLGGFALHEETVEPYIKDYDSEEEFRPSRWARQWDTLGWQVFMAFDGEQCVGGATLAWPPQPVVTAVVDVHTGCLWDLRVHPAYRGRGIGRQLFGRVAAAARGRDRRRLVIETQNTNVPACRFYARQGCVLGGLHRHAYAGLPHETQLLWYLEL